MLPAIAAVWLLVGAILVLQLWPDLPRSTQQWYLLFAFGPPLYVFGEAFFGWLFSAAHGRVVSERRFSVARIAIALLVGVALFALSGWLSWRLASA